MATDRQHQITALYHAALEREGRDRAAFLSEACAGDDALRRDVESLLGYEDVATPFLERPALDHAATLATRHPPAAEDLAGRQIGVYRIEAQIGAGGMGEVYRARDTKLGRDVAIKVLPSHLTSDPDRRARFEREARLLATLNHPHIAQVYGLEESEGLQALVMELVPGETLDEMISPPRRAMKIDAALALARQIADAMDAAHESGVIHRDLKPGNIVVTPSGAVKVLDFGLARAAAGDASGLDLTQLAMITADGAPGGVILGTPAYMSPEQARGKTVDKRTDIWAFGCVLYEMLTGRLAFAGDTTSDTIAAILEREPDWSALPAATPDTIRHLLQRCLEKDPKRRLRDIGDARAEIDEAIDKLDAQRRTGPIQATTKPAGWLRPRGAWFVTALAAVLISLAAVSWQWRPSGAAEREPGLSRLTHDPGLQTDPALSPDGQFVAYTSSRAGNFDIWVQQVDGGNPTQVTTDPSHDWQPDWSPNAPHRLVFRSERDGGGLMVMPAFGGPEQRISRFGYRPRWSPDGSQVLFVASNAMEGPSTPYTVTLDGTPPVKLPVVELTSTERQGAWGWNRKGGLTFLKAGGLAAPDFTPRLSTVVDVERGTTLRSVVDEGVKKAFHDLELTTGRAPLATSADGAVIYFVGESKRLWNLWAIDIDPRTLAITGGPRRLTRGAEANTYPSISAEGQRIAVGLATGNPRLWSFALNRAGTEVGDVSQVFTPAEMEARAFDLSGDGEKLVFSIGRPGSSQGPEVRVRQMSNGTEETLKFLEPGPVNFRWSQDGWRLVYRSVTSASAPAGQTPVSLHSVHILDRRTGDSTPLTSADPLLEAPSAWSPDDRFVISVGIRHKEWAGRTATDKRVWTVALVQVSAATTAESTHKVIAWSTDRMLFKASMSPDGKWVCFMAHVAGVGSQMVVVSSAGDNEWHRMTSGEFFDDKPRWSADGRLLYFISNRGGLYNVWAVRVDPVAGQPIGEPFRVTRFDGPGEMIDPNITVQEIGVGGGRLVLPLVTPTGGIWMLDGVKRQ